jgi:hypothetical protein
MSDFGDYDPDDAWDRNDTVVEQLRVIRERVEWLIEHRDDLPPRVQRILDDLAFIRSRVLSGELG